MGRLYNKRSTCRKLVFRQPAHEAAQVLHWHRIWHTWQYTTYGGLMGPSAESSAVDPSMKVPSAKMTSSPYPAVTPECKCGSRRTDTRISNSASTFVCQHQTQKQPAIPASCPSSTRKEWTLECIMVLGITLGISPPLQLHVAGYPCLL
jgi:hypothetical protein